MAYTFKHGDRPLDDFTVQRAVGSGGFGEVYYAISDGGREVALKYLRDNPQMELRGVSHTMNLKSPHLVSIFDVRKNTDGEYFIVMEYISGPSLRDLLIAEPDGLGPQKAAFFVREIGKGLAYLHDRGIVHRDLKPGNIFYDDGYVKIGDYGLSKFIAVSRHSAQTASIGTVHYMAPEIGSGDYSKSVDIYALGVMLYEMLLGKVPFEGSSMAEVLMKHLTSQPEVDNLPAPFGGIIRKALQKDPKDRYQSVDQMIEELLDVSSVQETLAGFSPHSLEGAVRRGSPEHANSPVPSPNPAAAFQNDFRNPQMPPQAFPVADAPPLPPRVARRMEKISRRVDQKMAKLAGRGGPMPHPPPYRAGGDARGHWDVTPPPPPSGSRHAPMHVAGSPITSADRFKRMVIALPLCLVLAVGTGFAGAGILDSAEAGAAAGMIVLALTISVVGGRMVVNWLGPNAGASWVRRIIELGAAAALLFPAAAPLLAGHNERWEQGMAITIGLLIALLFGRWRKGFDNGATGDFHLGNAFSAALFAFIPVSMTSGMFGVRAMPEVPFFAALIGAVTALVVHAMGWWLAPGPATWDDDERGGGSGGGSGGGWGEHHQAQAAPTPASPWDITQTAGPHTPPQAPPTAPPAGAQVAPITARHDPKLRWGVTRAFFGLVAFMLMGGAITTAAVPLAGSGFSYDDVTGFIVASVGCFSMMIFALRKTTPVKRIGFWRETVRPLFQSIALFGMGGSLTGILRHWYCGDEARIASIAGLVISIALFTVVTFIGRKPPKPRDFIRPGDSSYADDGGSSPDDTPESPEPSLA